MKNDVADFCKKNKIEIKTKNQTTVVNYETGQGTIFLGQKRETIYYFRVKI